MEYTCPEKRLLSVEHPGQVVNVDKAIQTLGGENALRIMADDPTQNNLELRFRPVDRFEHPIPSSTVKTSNILVRVRTDGVKLYDHEPIASIRHSVRFRGLSDYQWNTSQSPFLNELRDVLDTKDGIVPRKRLMIATKMSSWRLSETRVNLDGNLDIVPPPIFSHINVPQTYNYKQNPAARKIAMENGDMKFINRSRNYRQHLLSVTTEVKEIPTKPASELDKYPPLNETLDLVIQLRPMFDERAMWTRRAIVNRLGKDSYSLKFALPYVSYTWKQGPWRDLYARLGYDPRQDIASAMYQSIYFTTRTKEDDDKQNSGNDSHIFDGVTLYPRNRTFQFCDMKDGILVQILRDAKKRAAPDPRHGWWPSRTLQGIRAIVKSKLTQLCAGQVPSDVEFADILKTIHEPDDIKVDDEAAAEAEDEDQNIDDDENMIDPQLLKEDARVSHAMQSLEQQDTDEGD